MNVDESASEGGSPQPSVFATTHWSVILAAGQADSSEAMIALEELCQTYRYPLYAFVRLQQELALMGKGQWFNQLRQFIIEGSQGESSAQVARHLGSSEEAVRKAVQRLRHRYREIV